MPIYTRKGDKGVTSLLGNTKVAKNHIRVEAYGTIDELNSVVGMAISMTSSRLKLKNLTRVLLQIQNDLLLIGSTLANPESQQPIDLKKRVRGFEDLIDQLTDQLPELHNFILPGGTKVGSLLHFARVVSRRAERRVVALAKKERVDQGILMYLNRLSDLFFTMARWANFKEKKKEIIWTGS